MANTGTMQNLHPLNSSNISCPPFSLPKKTPKFSCPSLKTTPLLHPIKFHYLGHPNLATVFPHIRDDRADLIVAKAAEVVTPASAEEALTDSNSSKKAKNKKYPRRILDVYQILQNPIITESAIKNIADENALLFTVDVRADKKMIRDAVTNFFDVKVRKVNTSIRPDGTKKAFIMLSKEYNASDIAKSIGIFPK